MALLQMNEDLVEKLKKTISAFREKGKEFHDVIKMGRTQLQDAVPMTLGQEFEAFAATLEEDISKLNANANLFVEINMGATAIGTEFGSRHELYEINYIGSNDITRLTNLWVAQGSGNLDRFKAFAQSAMDEYDLDGWTVPDLINPDDVSVLRSAPRGS